MKKARGLRIQSGPGSCGPSIEPGPTGSGQSPFQLYWIKKESNKKVVSRDCSFFFLFQAGGKNNWSEKRDKRERLFGFLIELNLFMTTMIVLAGSKGLRSLSLPLTHNPL